jgi:hypothetical protein
VLNLDFKGTGASCVETPSLLHNNSANIKKCAPPSKKRGRLRAFGMGARLVKMPVEGRHKNAYRAIKVAMLGATALSSLLRASFVGWRDEPHLSLLRRVLAECY